jgi:hypothetical protein
MAKAQYPERWSGQTRDWSLPDTVTLNPNKKNRLDSIAASNDDDLTHVLDLSAKLLEQERLDGAGDGSRQVADAARQYG